MAARTKTKTFDCNWISLGNGRLTLWHRLGTKASKQLKMFGCDCVVTLLSFKEGANSIGKIVEEAGIEWLWLPLENGQPPQGTTANRVFSTLRAIADRLDAGTSILIHCSAGIHRTGMVAYALLRWHGRNEEQALADIGKMRTHTLSGLQRKHIEWGNDAVRLDAYPATQNFLCGNEFKLRYAPHRRIPGWSIRKRLVDQYDNRPILFEYICPFCGYAIEGSMYAGWKHCICPTCEKESDFTVTLNSPYGYFYGGGICDGKELFDAGYFEWVSNLPD